MRSNSQPRSFEYAPLSSYQLPLPLQQLYNPSNSLQPSVLNPVTKEKPDVIATIIVKIFDHVLSAVPTIIERIFGRGIYDLFNFSDYNNYSNYNGYGYYNGQNDLQKLFRGLGILGYGPLIILKIIDGFTTFMNILRRNSFFRTFLLPALVLMLIAGSVIFLIWWLQPDNFTSNYQNVYQSSNGQNQYYSNVQPHYNNYRQYSGPSNNKYRTMDYNQAFVHQGYNGPSRNIQNPQSSFVNIYR
ncbi:unnamed protein product [Acanthoscelides obtectus]|nr:unnamed protein product [Acanthoscelides obtectus]CAK1668792.1 hypothetical protein AOBTE_LOCUS26610 [Acanthoscelides obtectus]